MHPTTRGNQTQPNGANDVSVEVNFSDKKEALSQDHIPICAGQPALRTSKMRSLYCKTQHRRALIMNIPAMQDRARMAMQPMFRDVSPEGAPLPLSRPTGAQHVALVLASRHFPLALSSPLQI